jgi:GxxExxY protein
MKTGENILYKDESYRIIGACLEVYKDKGCEFLEAVYQECLGIEFELQGIPFVPQAKLALTYKGRALAQTYAPDFVCFDKIIVELKAVRELADEHRAQTLNYLKATGFRLGLLVNFGHHPLLQSERLLL